jgi:hypothetical protein
VEPGAAAALVAGDEPLVEEDLDGVVDVLVLAGDRDGDLVLRAAVVLLDVGGDALHEVGRAPGAVGVLGELVAADGPLEGVVAGGVEDEGAGVAAAG